MSATKRIVRRKIQNIKLYNYLKKYKDDILEKYMIKYAGKYSNKTFRRLYISAEIKYLKDISKIKSIEEMPQGWYKYFEELEIQNIL